MGPRGVGWVVQAPTLDGGGVMFPPFPAPTPNVFATFPSNSVYGRLENNNDPTSDLVPVSRRCPNPGGSHKRRGGGVPLSCFRWFSMGTSLPPMGQWINKGGKSTKQRPCARAWGANGKRGRRDWRLIFVPHNGNEYSALSDSTTQL